MDTTAAPSIHAWLDEPVDMREVTHTNKHGTYASLHHVSCTTTLPDGAAVTPVSTRRTALRSRNDHCGPCGDHIRTLFVNPGLDRSQVMQLVYVLQEVAVLERDLLRSDGGTASLLARRAAALLDYPAHRQLWPLALQAQDLCDRTQEVRALWAASDEGRAALVLATSGSVLARGIPWVENTLGLDHRSFPRRAEEVLDAVELPTWCDLTDDELEAVRIERLTLVEEILADARGRAQQLEAGTGGHLLYVGPLTSITTHEMLLRALGQYRYLQEAYLFPRALEPLVRRSLKPAQRSASTAVVKDRDPRVLETALVLLRPGTLSLQGALKAARAIERT